VVRGDGPIVLGLPHTGTHIPPEIAARLNETGTGLSDTDWHVHRLYEGLLDGVTTVRATFHRYVIDANRDPGGVSLYPGQNTTSLVPLTDFDNTAIWRMGAEPDTADTDARLKAFHGPYHAALDAELIRVRKRHGVAVLYDCHSIRSTIPFLFDGRLPDFNIGDNEGTTCDRSITESVKDICDNATSYSTILNGRFKGGWTTRHYGKPQTGVHAIQMELAQSAYLETENAPFDYDETRAGNLRLHLALILKHLEDLALNTLKPVKIP